MENKMQTPTVEEVLKSESVHFYLKGVLKTFLDKDPIDALYDAKLLVKVLENNLAEIEGR